MDVNYQEYAERAVAYAKGSNVELDYSKESIAAVDSFLGSYYDKLGEYEGGDGADTLWNIAVHFGIYLGEVMLRLQLKDMGYEWYIEGEMPIIRNNKNMQMSPITKAHKRILNGPEDSVKSFCDPAFLFADGKFPPKKG